MVPSSSSNCSTETLSGWSTSWRTSDSRNVRIARGTGSLACGRVDALGAQQLAHGVGGLSALGQPRADPVLVELDRRRLGLRVVLANRLDEPAVARGALVGDDHPPDRVLLAAHTREPESYCHGDPLECLTSRRRRVA